MGGPADDNRETPLRDQESFMDAADRMAEWLERRSDNEEE